MYLQQSEPLLISAANMVNADLVKLCRKRSRAQLSQATSSTNDDDATISVATKKRRVSVKKSVGFSANLVQTIDGSAVSSPGTWIHASEYTAFKVNMKRDVMYLASLCQQNKCHTLNRDEYCPLGLEKYCCSSAEQLRSKQIKLQRMYAVLHQQKWHSMMGVATEKDETIRTIAAALAKPVVDKAALRAARLHVCISVFSIKS